MKAIQFNPAIPRYLLGRALGQNMPGILWSGYSCTKYAEFPEIPLPADSWVKIKTRLGGICGTDLSTVRLHTSLSLTPFSSFPCVLGHEGVGSISEVGAAVHDFHPGERVVIEPILWCTPRGVDKACRNCLRGEISLCERAAEGKLSPGMSIGFCRDTGGSWSEQFVAHRAQLYRVPQNVSDKNALMVEPFSTALHSVLNNFPKDDETVLVLGAGTVGLCIIAALRALGSRARLLVLARHNFQAEAARKLGANLVFLGSGARVFKEVADSVGAEIKKPMIGKPVMVGGADRIFECVGSQPSIGDALAMTRSGGRVVLVGMPSSISLDWTPISVKELTVKSSWAYHHAEVYAGKTQSTFELALDLMSEGKVDLGWVVTHTFSLKDYKQAFEMLTRKGHHQVIKAAFEFA